MIRRPPRPTLFPTRRSSDLAVRARARLVRPGAPAGCPTLARRHVRAAGHGVAQELGILLALQDRKSTRLNSSHPSISYAVFCLKKKTIHGLLPDAAPPSDWH